MSEKVRVLRVMEYVGDREWVEETLSKGGVPANGEIVLRGQEKGRLIKSSLVGTFPEILSKEEVKYYDHRINDDRREFTIIQDFRGSEGKCAYSLKDSSGDILISSEENSLDQIKGFMAALGHLRVNAHTNYERIED